MASWISADVRTFNAMFSYVRLHVCTAKHDEIFRMPTKSKKLTIYYINLIVFYFIFQDLTPITEEIEEERIEILKEWCKFSMIRHRNEIQQIDRMLYSQKAALEKLRELDQNLYKMAIQIDNNLVPFNAKGPLSTPPIPEYIQDGEYEDVTRKYEVKYDNMESFLREVIKNNRAKKKKKTADEDEE